MKKVEIEIPDGKRAEWVNGVLTLVDDDVRVRIKTFEDACTELGKNHQYVRAYREWMRISYAECEDIAAYMKLRIITAALNEGWEPQFTEGERRWYFWYDLITKEQYNELSAEDKSRVVSRGGYNAYTGGGLVFAIADNAGSVSFSSYGVRLAFKSKELAEYAGKQFIDIYKDFCFKTLNQEQ